MTALTGFAGQDEGRRAAPAPASVPLDTSASAGRDSEAITEAEWRGALSLLQGAGHVLIFGHKKPDGDTIGSLLGLSHTLQGLGKQTTLVCADPLSDPLARLPGAEGILTQLPGFSSGAVPARDGVLTSDGVARSDGIHGAYPDVIVTVDVAALDRLGAVYESAAGLFARLAVLNIDHHYTNDRFGTVNLVDPQAAAAAEVVTLLLQRLGAPPALPAATCLLAGMLTDTLSFQTDSTTARTLRLAAELVEAGAPLAPLAYQLFRQRPRGNALLWSQALGTLRFAAGGRIAWLEVTREMLAAAGPGADSTGLSGFTGAITGVDVGIVIEEGADGPIYVGLRSQSVDVAALAARFGGGGHRRAAGCQFPPPTTVAEAREAMLSAVEAHLTALAASA